MTANIYHNRIKKGLGIPNLRSRQNAAFFLRRRNFFGASEKTVRSVFAVKVADFAQYWSGAEIPVMHTTFVACITDIG